MFDSRWWFAMVYCYLPKSSCCVKVPPAIKHIAFAVTIVGESGQSFTVSFLIRLVDQPWSAFFGIVRRSSTHFPYEKHVAGHVESGSSTPRLSQVRVQLPKLSSGEQAAETRQLRKNVELNKNNGLLWSFLTARLWKSWNIYVALLRLIIFFEIFERRSNSITFYDCSV